MSAGLDSSQHSLGFRPKDCLYHHSHHGELSDPRRLPAESQDALIHAGLAIYLSAHTQPLISRTWQLGIPEIDQSLTMFGAQASYSRSDSWSVTQADTVLLFVPESLLVYIDREPLQLQQILQTWLHSAATATSANSRISIPPWTSHCDGLLSATLISHCDDGERTNPLLCRSGAWVSLCCCSWEERVSVDIHTATRQTRTWRLRIRCMVA